jgi:hypothetical protein
MLQKYQKVISNIASPEINITNSISIKNFFSGRAKTIFFEKMAPIKTNMPINKP